MVYRYELTSLIHRPKPATGGIDGGDVQECESVFDNLETSKQLAYRPRLHALSTHKAIRMCGIADVWYASVGRPRGSGAHGPRGHGSVWPARSVVAQWCDPSLCCWNGYTSQRQPHAWHGQPIQALVCSRGPWCAVLREIPRARHIAHVVSTLRSIILTMR